MISSLTHTKPSYSTYSKRPTSYEEQLFILKQRGMDFSGYDEDQIKQILQRIGYYHLTPYWLIFKDNTSADEHFNAGTTFKRVLDLYYFDRELRLLLLDGIESFEVHFRTVFAHYLSIRYDTPFPHMQKQIFKDVPKFLQSLSKLLVEYSLSKELFARHFREKYAEVTPPIWVVTEFMTLGELSKWYENLEYIQDKEKIALHFHIKYRLLESFLNSLTLIRNFAAHQSRLWNRRIINKLVKPNCKSVELYENFNLEVYKEGKESEPCGVYNTIVLLIYCLKHTGSSLDIASELKQKLEKFNVEPRMMGFPEDWKSRSLWK